MAAEELIGIMVGGGIGILVAPDDESTAKFLLLGAVFGAAMGAGFRGTFR